MMTLFQECLQMKFVHRKSASDAKCFRYNSVHNANKKILIHEIPLKPKKSNKKTDPKMKWHWINIPLCFFYRRQWCHQQWREDRERRRLSHARTSHDLRCVRSRILNNEAIVRISNERRLSISFDFGQIVKCVICTRCRIEIIDTDERLELSTLKIYMNMKYSLFQPSYQTHRHCRTPNYKLIFCALSSSSGS